MHAEETYSVEAGIGVENYKSDSSDTNTNKFLRGTCYFKPVAIKDSQPFTELEFLQRSSNASFQYANLDIDRDTIEPATLKPITLGGTFYLDDFVLNVGYFVLPTTLVSFSKSQNVDSYGSVAGSATIKDQTTTRNGLTAHTVMPLRGTDSIVGDIYLQKISYDDGSTTQNNNAFGFDVTYFPAMNYYFGGGLMNNSGDDASQKGTTLQLTAGYQFTPRLGLLFTTSKFTVSDDAEKSSNTHTQLLVGYQF